MKWRPGLDAEVEWRIGHFQKEGRFMTGEERNALSTQELSEKHWVQRHLKRHVPIEPYEPDGGSMQVIFYPMMRQRFMYRTERLIAPITCAITCGSNQSAIPNGSSLKPSSKSVTKKKDIEKWPCNLCPRACCSCALKGRKNSSAVLRPWPA
ncbi:DUF3304 domain-containing protein [Neisseria musculi]|uniref:DUF3304 domain-containing protein n=1 Tax=Neisseria musculi TaxID=1815583 RepID=UPI00336C25A6